MAWRRLRKSDYEEYLNGLYSPDDAMQIGEYMKSAQNLLSRGKYGTALRRYDSIAFMVGYQEWVDTHA